MRMIDIIRERLSQLSPSLLEIEDQSHLHKGHAGARAEGETHFSVTIISDSFQGLSRIKRHQLVYKLLEEELKTRIHALALHTFTQKEFSK